MYRIKTKYRNQEYYWYGNNIFWKLTEHASKTFNTRAIASIELNVIKQRGGWSSEFVEIVEVGK